MNFKEFGKCLLYLRCHFLALIIAVIVPLSPSSALELGPSSMSVPSGCDQPLTGEYSAIYEWRRKAIEQIQNGLRQKGNPFAIVDMSPFIPKNLDASAAHLTSGMVALYDGKKREIEAGQYFDGLYGDALDDRLPSQLFRWIRNINEFTTSMVEEAIKPFYSRGTIRHKGKGQAKVAVGGQSYTAGDEGFHTDGNSFVTIVFNAAGNIGTSYKLREQQEPTVRQTPSYDVDGLNPSSTLSRVFRSVRIISPTIFGPEIQAPSYSLIIMPGQEWERAGLGPAIKHRATNALGPRIGVIQFIDRR